MDNISRIEKAAAYSEVGLCFKDPSRPKFSGIFGPNGGGESNLLRWCREWILITTENSWFGILFFPSRDLALWGPPHSNLEQIIFILFLNIMGYTLKKKRNYEER